MFDRTYPAMTVKEAVQIVKKLSQSTYLDSQKDEAIRKVMCSVSAFNTLSRANLAVLCEYMYENYMVKEKEE